MHVQINTDHHVELTEAFATYVRGTLEERLSWYQDHITRVEVHLSDQSGHKITPNDKRCVMELRLEGLPPLSAHKQAATYRGAIDGAGDKLSRMVQRKVRKLRDREFRAVPLSHAEVPAA
ncbi:MAG: ribosome-associated translation inhibitor RaiA [Betaproteobacteria bacterium]|nr:ribosome-associated translation inhibitor RaiA [Betaproteobacteria bacterium]